MSLWMPSRAANEVARDRAAVAAQYFGLKGVLDEYNQELRRIDPRLSLVKAHDNLAPESPLKAGYYHIILEAPGHPTTILPLEYDNGEYREPGSWIYEFMERNDMWNDRARRASRNRQERIREAADRRRQSESEDRAAQFNERWASANRTSIRVKRDI